jgi:hypothetical protein
MKWGNVFRWQTGLWSIKTKVSDIVPRATWYRGGDSTVVNDPFRALGSTPSYQHPYPYGVLQVVTSFPWFS